MQYSNVDVINARIAVLTLPTSNYPAYQVYSQLYSPLFKVLDHQVAADVKGDFLSNFRYILIIFK